MLAWVGMWDAEVRVPPVCRAMEMLAPEWRASPPLAHTHPRVHKARRPPYSQRRRIVRRARYALASSRPEGWADQCRCALPHPGPEPLFFAVE